MSANLYWLRRDLRFHDNPALAAARSSAGLRPVFAVYSVAELAALNHRQQAFVVGCLGDMRAAGQRRDFTVSMLSGDPVVAIVAAARRLDAAAVYCARSYSPGERRLESDVAAALGAAGIALHASSGNLVHEPEAVAELKQAAGAGYRVFPPFFERWQSLSVAPAGPASWPSGRDPDMGLLPDLSAPLAPPEPACTELSARKTLTAFCGGRLADYATNGEYPARDGTSHLAASLRFGTLSAREVYRMVATAMDRSWTLSQERESMKLFLRRLALRDFYTHLAFFAPESHDVELQVKMRAGTPADDADRLEAWANGRTGYPFVDAAMRQLAREGQVHQRAAIVAASFCCFDLGLDWRAGRNLWMAQLLAADEALCDANWQRIAGVGTDQAGYPRIYNPTKQARHFDAQAVYVRRYCPELGRLPTGAALAPWELARQQQIELGFFTARHYPPPIVDHDTAARAALRRYKAQRSR